MNPAILREAHAWWFGSLSGPADFPAAKAATWFEVSDATDDHIRRTFGPHLSAVASAAWPPADLGREERVGLVVFLDQFPRNIFRESAEAFAHDARAREIAATLIDNNYGEYYLIERAFLILPFEHSEQLADQDKSVRLAEELAAAAPAGNDFFPSLVEYAAKHRDLIRRFGRFPHRNAALGRESTPEEAAFLKEHGRGY